MTNASRSAITTWNHRRARSRRKRPPPERRGRRRPGPGPPRSPAPPGPGSSRYGPPPGRSPVPGLLTSDSRRNDAGLGTHVLPPDDVQLERHAARKYTLWSLRFWEQGPPINEPTRGPASAVPGDERSRAGRAQTTGVLANHEDCVTVAGAARPR